MEPQAIDLIARTAFLEFLLEVTHAQSFAVRNDPEFFTKWRDDILKLIRFHTTIKNDPDDIGLVVQNKMIEIAEQFFERVESRATKIAAELSRPAQESQQEYDH